MLEQASRVADHVAKLEIDGLQMGLQPLAAFGVGKKGEVASVTQPAFLPQQVQVRDIKLVKTTGQSTTVAVAANNRPIYFFTPNTRQP